VLIGTDGRVGTIRRAEKVEDICSFEEIPEWLR
jgi:hypothetical protein